MADEWNTPSLVVDNLPSGTYLVRVYGSNCATFELEGTNGSNIVLSCPNNITVTEPAPNEGGMVVYWNEPTATSDCNIGQVQINQTSGIGNNEVFPVGVTTVQYQASDNCNNFATCSFDVTVLENADNGSAPDNYCGSSGTAPWQQWISNVNFGTINNDSGKDLYGDFTHLSTNVQGGQSYVLTLKPKFSWLSYNLSWRVWIDYNRDGDFFDSGEKVFESTTNNLTVQGSIIIPNTASHGGTRMRVSMNRGGYTDPCMTFGNGEVEDYTIQISNNLTGEVDNRSNGQSDVSSNSSKIELFPNPTTGLVNVNLAAYEGKDMDIQVIDQLGRVVKQYQYEEVLQQVVKLNLQDLNDGLYFIQFKTKEESPMVKRLIISQ